MGNRGRKILVAAACAFFLITGIAAVTKIDLANQVFGTLAAGSVANTVTAVKTANYTANSGEFVPCNTSGGGFNITLPAASSNSGKEISVHIVTGGLAANPVTMVATGGDTIEITSFYALHTSITFMSDGSSNWYVK